MENNDANKGNSSSSTTESIIKVLGEIAKTEDVAGGIIKMGNSLIDIIRSKPYGIVHKSCPITYLEKKGRLVWDYVLYNELTFEDIETGKKYSLATGWSDKKIEATFNELVEKFGDKN